MPRQLAPYGAGWRHPAPEIGKLLPFLHHLPKELVTHNQFDKYTIDGDDSAFTVSQILVQRGISF